MFLIDHKPNLLTVFVLTSHQNTVFKMSITFFNPKESQSKFILNTSNLSFDTSDCAHYILSLILTTSYSASEDPDIFLILCMYHSVVLMMMKSDEDEHSKSLLYWL